MSENAHIPSQLPSTPAIPNRAGHGLFRTRSLRWRLQTWHGLVLVIVVTTFGMYLYRHQWESHLHQVDRELNRTAQVILSRLRRSPSVRQRPVPSPVPSDLAVNAPTMQPVDSTAKSVFARVGGSFGEDELVAGRPSPTVEVPIRIETVRAVKSDEPVSALTVLSENRSLLRIHTVALPAISRTALEELGRWIPRTRDRRVSFNVGVPDEFLNPPDHPLPSPVYFILYDSAGHVIERSSAAPNVEFPAMESLDSNVAVWENRSRDGYREVIHAPFRGLNLVVGRSLTPDLQYQHRLGLAILGGGGAIVFAGLLGGWWLTGYAIRPIGEMARTAATISEKNLRQRIDIQDTDSELGRLGTVLNETFDRLEAAFERQSQFSADASHELRTPVAVILAQTQLAMTRNPSLEDYATTIESCNRAAVRLRQLIDSLLHLSRLDSGDTEPDLQDVDLAEIAHSVSSQLAPLACERSIAIEVTGKPVRLRADRLLIIRVFENLLSNAIRYHREGGHVVVAVSRGQDSAQFSITDNGPGIAAEHLPKLGNRFFRVDHVRSRRDGGTGLGLSICQEIVALHKGSMTIESTPGVGTCVTVSLPIAGNA